MALVHIRLESGEVVLIHTSQIGPAGRRPADCHGSAWSRTWERFDREKETADVRVDRPVPRCEPR